MLGKTLADAMIDEINCRSKHACFKHSALGAVPTNSLPSDKFSYD